VAASLDYVEAVGGEDRRQVWKISELTRRIKGALEREFGSVWVEGEISNLRKPQSGHAYFTLKDAGSQLNAVMFRSALSGAPMPLRDGLLVRAYGQITVYEASGEYQILVKRIEPAGEGALMLKFEALKRKLAAEGLFDSSRKRSLPALPQHVGIVTSPTGAAIRDILNVLNRRFANLHVVLAPARVQGAGAAEEIAAAIELLNARGGLDAMIVGRGGGSLEDLWCFNEEVVVRAIVASGIPVISAVGHEIDTTLSDYAADLRAPTPSAAAELVVRGKDELERRLADARRRLALGARGAVQDWRHRIDRAARVRGLRDPLDAVRRMQQGVDFLAVRFQRALAGLPQLVRQRAEAAARRMELAVRMGISERRRALDGAESQLRLLNPKAVLSRGYSLTRLPDGRMLRCAADAPPGTRLETELADGTVRSTVLAAEGEPGYGDGKKRGQAAELREGAGAAGGDRGGDGARRPGARKNGGGVRGGPEAGQALLF
jgi:exodeoxyribonuclease VII large subunit